MQHVAESGRTHGIPRKTLTNALWLALTTHLATRLQNGDYYLTWALNQWIWYMNSGLIQSDFLIVQSLNVQIYKAISNGPTYSQYSYWRAP
jgi:hypothetical protein